MNQDEPSLTSDPSPDQPVHESTVLAAGAKELCEEAIVEVAAKPIDPSEDESKAVLASPEAHQCEAKDREIGTLTERITYLERSLIRICRRAKVDFGGYGIDLEKYE